MSESVISKRAARGASVGSLVCIGLLHGVPAAAQSEVPAATESEVGEGGIALPADERRSAVTSDLPTLRLSSGETSTIVSENPTDRDVRLTPQSVRGRSRPEYDPIGINVGGFTLFPELSGRAVYDSNVLAQSNGQSDLSSIVNGRIRGETNWAVNRAVVEAGIRQQEYTDLGSESGTEYDLQASGNFEYTTGGTFSVSALREHRLVDRGAVGEVLRTQKPVRLDRSSALASTRLQRGLVYGELSGRIDKFDYADARDPEDNLSNQQFRDATRYQLGAAGGVRIGPELYGFVSAERAWRRARLNSVPNRDTNELQILAGVRSEISPLWSGSVAAGYLQADFEDPTIDTRRSFALNANAEYYFTPLTTISLELDRSIQGIASVTTPAALVTSGRLSVDHELLRNLILSVSTSYEKADFEASDATTDRFGLYAGAEYRLSRRISITGGANYLTRNREDVDSGLAFSRFSANIGVNFRL